MRACWAAREGRIHHHAQGAGQVAVHPERHSDGHDGHEEIGGDGKGGPGFLDASQVDQHDQEHGRHGKQNTIVKQGGVGRYDLGDAGGDRDGDRQDVVGEQGGPGGLGRQLSQVIAGDDVGAAAAGIGMDGLFVGNGDDRQQRHDGHGNGEEIAVGNGSGAGDDAQDLLGGIGGGGQGVGGKNGQPYSLADGLVRGVGGGDGPADDPRAQGARRLAVGLSFDNGGG